VLTNTVMRNPQVVSHLLCCIVCMKRVRTIDNLVQVSSLPRKYVVAILNQFYKTGFVNRTLNYNNLSVYRLSSPDCCCLRLHRMNSCCIGYH